MRKSSQIEIPKKTAWQEFSETIIVTVIGCFILHVITEALRVIFFPFHYLIDSDAKLQELSVKNALRKSNDRDNYLEKFRSDPADPMNQYYDRFTDNPDSYRNDPDNSSYLQWYVNWRNGQIRDSRMRWCPDAYVKMDGKKCLNPEYLKYARVQYELHQEAPWVARQIFLMTIGRYFPELTPNFRTMEDELDELQKRYHVRHLTHEIREEILKIGVPSLLADELLEMNVDGRELRSIAEKIHNAMEAGICGRLAMHLAVNGLDIGSEKSFEANKMVTSGVPLNVADAYVRGQIDLGDVTEIVEWLAGILEVIGVNAMAPSTRSNCTVYEDIASRKLKKLIRKNRQVLVENVLDNQGTGSI